MALLLHGLKVTGAARTRANGEATIRRRRAVSDGVAERRNMLALRAVWGCCVGAGGGVGEGGLVMSPGEKGEERDVKPVPELSTDRQSAMRMSGIHKIEIRCSLPPHVY